MAEVGNVYAATAAPDVGVPRLQAVLPLLEAQGPSPSLTALYHSLAYLLFINGHYPEYLTTIERTTAMARELGDHQMLAIAQMQLGNALQLLGHVEEALQVTDQAVALAQETGDLPTLAIAWNNKAFIHLYWGEFDLLPVAPGNRLARSVSASAIPCGPLWLPPIVPCPSSS